MKITHSADKAKHRKLDKTITRLINWSNLIKRGGERKYILSYDKPNMQHRANLE